VSGRLSAALRSLVLEVSGVEVQGLFVRVSGEPPLCIFMVFERSALCCSASVVIVSMEFRCNGTDHSMDMAGKDEELLSIGSIFQALAPSGRLDVLGTRQIPTFPLYRQGSVDGII
jgi:hypothetical protein